MRLLPKKGKYEGRLAFDGEFHVDPKGRRVVTDDGGKSWRYAKRSDASHFARYHRQFVVVDGTANAENPESHHFNVQPGDPHVNGLVSHPDVEGPTVTGHTAAWKEEA